MIDYTQWNSFISLDLGYGDLKLALKKEDGTLLVAKFPSAVAKVMPKRFSKGDTVEFEGDHYLVGAEALNYKPIEMIDFETLKKYAPLLIHHAFKKYGEFGTIVTGLSIRQDEYSSEFKERISNFVIDGEEYNLDVRLLPQGIGAKIAAQDQFQDIQNYLIVDGGFNTVDLVPVFGGKADPHAIDAIEARGIVEVCNDLIDYVSAEMGIELSSKEAKYVLDNKKITIYGKETDLKDQIAKITKSYTQDLLKQIERKFKKSWTSFDKIIVVGGLGHFIDTSVLPHLATLTKPEYYNAVGFYKFFSEKIPDEPTKPQKRKVNRPGTL